MLTITIPDREYYDEIKEEFITVEGATLQLEHSLYSVSKWESKWKKPFFTNKEKTKEESFDYIRCMTINEDVDPSIYDHIPIQCISEIQKYIEEQQTATWFSEDKKSPPSREVITAEIIYYWMVAQNVPFECQYWHISKLITLLRVCNIKNAPEKKMSKSQIAKRNRSLNAARRSRLGTKG